MEEPAAAVAEAMLVEKGRVGFRKWVGAWVEVTVREKRVVLVVNSLAWVRRGESIRDCMEVKMASAFKVYMLLE